MYNRDITKKQRKTDYRKQAIQIVRDEIVNKEVDRKDYKKQVNAVIRWLESNSK